MKTADEIYADFKDAFAESFGRDISDDCDMAVRLYAAAAEIESLYIYNGWVVKQCFPQSAEGEFLDNHAKMRGLERNGALKAYGTVRFSIQEAAESDIEVPSGTVCLTSSGIYFKTTESAVITAGSLYCDAAAEAEEAGSSGNVAAGKIMFMSDAPIGVSSCMNPYAFSGGLDKETDESLRVRVINSFRKLPNGANKAYYEKEALEVDGVAAAVVLPKNRGLGTVDVVITTESGLPSQGLIDEVAAKLETAREICVDVGVYGPETKNIDIEVDIDVADGYSFDDVSNAVSGALSAYFGGKLLGTDITRAELGRVIYGVEGVKNYLIKDPVSDAACGAAELPCLGDVTVNGWS